jgi:hypothetical protein
MPQYEQYGMEGSVERKRLQVGMAGVGARDLG